MVAATAGCGASKAGGDSGRPVALEHTCENVTCPPDAACREAACVLAGPCEGVECPEEDTVCSRGRCVPSLADEDGDGAPAFEDCDDTDPAVYPGTMASCSTWCGEGTTTCRDGGWTTCTAPIDCACASGAERREECGSCGVAIRTCADGTWNRRAGRCDADGECAADTTGVESCGQCLARTRPCDDGCHWGEWGACESIALSGGELCNAWDDDCDGSVDEGFDEDSDGTTTCAGDCNDADAAVHPGARDGADGIDNDCDGALDEDDPIGGGS